MAIPKVSDLLQATAELPSTVQGTGFDFAAYLRPVRNTMATIDMLFQRLTALLIAQRLGELASSLELPGSSTTKQGGSKTRTAQADRAAHDAHRAHEAHVAHEAHEAHVAHEAHEAHRAREAHRSRVAHEARRSCETVEARPTPSPSSPSTSHVAPSARSTQASPDAAVQAATGTPAGVPRPRATRLDALDRSFDPSEITFAAIRSPAEARKRDAQIHDAHSFAAAVDEAAARYGIPREVLRSQVQAETWGFGNATNADQYLTGMKHRGDTDRGDNASRGLLQVSGNFLDGGAWSGSGPNNPRVGGRSVSRADYDASITLQLDVGAANLAQRIVDGGGLREGLSSYFSGSYDTRQASAYLRKIDNGLRDEYAQGL